MKIYKQQNVLDAARERIGRLFDEFKNIVIGYSGGKDSTVIFELSMGIAKEKNRLPLNVMFLDQEAEWRGTVDMVEKVMTNKDVKPYWFQMPMVMTNNASSFNRYNHCWDENNKDKWIHDKHEISIKENKYNTERFHELFEAILKVEFKNEKTCYLAGVRTEESPKRFVGLTDTLKYKDITWGKRLYREYEHFTFYPIYDWSFRDVWKYILDNNIEYNKVYDGMYQHGLGCQNMRISNLHHETAIQGLLDVQKIEPKTWEKVVARIDGANSIKHIKQNSYSCPKELPYMFKDWEEYATYLADNIIQEKKNRDYLQSVIANKKVIYSGEKVINSFWRVIINTILSSDWDYTKLTNYEMHPYTYVYRMYKKGKFHKIDLSKKSISVFTEKELNEIKIKQYETN